MSRTRVPFVFEPLRAARAVVALVRDPEDTAQVFSIVEALSCGSAERMVARFERDPVGARLLRERPRLLDVLSDRARLEAMPEGSLAKAYVAFLDREGISAAGLVDASKTGAPERVYADESHRFVSDRMRDTHDLWHAVTGYQGDVLGEASLLAFGLAHAPNPGIAVIVLAGLLRAHDADFTRSVLTGLRHGRAAAWLPAVDWEPLLPLPLDEVRRRLGIVPAPPYEQVRSGWQAAAESPRQAHVVSAEAHAA